jgi:hypothetical protein
MSTDVPVAPALAVIVLNRARGAVPSPAAPPAATLAATRIASAAHLTGPYPARARARPRSTLDESVLLCRIYLTSSTTRNVLRISRCLVSDNGSFTSCRMSRLSAVMALMTPSANRSFVCAMNGRFASGPCTMAR